LVTFFRRLTRRQRPRNTWVDENGLHIAKAFSHNGTGEVRAYIQEYNGRELAHIRHFIRGKDGRARPTKKGIAVEVGELPQLADAIDALLAVAEARA
jgi:hypothetical protein